MRGIEFLRNDDRRDNFQVRGGGGGGGRQSMGMPQSGGRMDEMPGNTDLLSYAELQQKKKATGRCRLFIGNIPLEVKDEEVKELFGAHGSVEEFFLSGKGFAFIRMVCSWRGRVMLELVATGSITL